MMELKFGVGNFTRFRRRALEAVDEYLRKAAKPEGQQILSEFHARLSSRETKSFLLPHNGDVVDRNTPSILTLENCRLPFASMALEYSNSLRKNSETKWYPDATVLLVSDLRETADEAIFCMCLWRAQGQWTPSSFGFLINPKTEIEIQSDGNVMMRNITSYRLKGQVTTHLAHDEIMQDICDEAAVLTHFSLLCNCDNVSPVKVFEPSAALVRSSIERNRIPPDEYYVLDCFLGEHAERADPQGGSHASPRFHVRRGHIRRLADGRRTWVKQCSVGDASNGIIDKDYRVRVRAMDATA